MCGLTVSHMGEARGDRSSNLIEYNDLLWWQLEGQIPLSRESALAKIIGTQYTRLAVVGYALGVIVATMRFDPGSPIDQASQLPIHNVVLISHGIVTKSI